MLPNAVLLWSSTPTQADGSLLPGGSGVDPMAALVAVSEAEQRLLHRGGRARLSLLCCSCSCRCPGRLSIQGSFNMR